MVKPKIREREFLSDLDHADFMSKIFYEVAGQIQSCTILTYRASF